MFLQTLRRMAYPTAESEQVTDGSQERFVDTEDFVATAERVTHRELSWFFEDYLRQPELPELEVEQHGEELVLHWLSPLQADFPLPVPVEIDGEVQRVEMPGGSGSVTVGSRRWRIDPQEWLLRVQ